MSSLNLRGIEPDRMPHHPECRDDEEFHQNISKADSEALSLVHELNYRLGTLAYARDASFIESCLPVFRPKGVPPIWKGNRK